MVWSRLSFQDLLRRETRDSLRAAFLNRVSERMGVALSKLENRLANYASGDVPGAGSVVFVRREIDGDSFRLDVLLTALVKDGTAAIDMAFGGALGEHDFRTIAKMTGCHRVVRVNHDGVSFTPVYEEAA